jgi:hypothetical protein
MFPAEVDWLQGSGNKFPPSLWNVHDATLADKDRTNNLCESLNCGFASLVGHHHPSLWELV